MNRRLFCGVLATLALSGCSDSSKPVASGTAPTVRFTVPEGAGLFKVAGQLEQKKLIRSAKYLRQLGKKPIQPGLYELSPSETPEQILQKLEKGETIATRVTIPEGFTLKKIAARLKEKGVIADEDAFLTLATEPENLEGYLFPDTYFFAPGISPEAVIAQMRSNFTARVETGMDWDNKSRAEIITVASLVEREAVTDADRPKIAGVIYNRLARHIKLEIDATVQYALPEHKARLLYSDLKIDSPYNTYRVVGLPPGPICSPGLASIQAALKPEKHDYLYYVLGATGKGHVFAKTFAEHKINVVQYRKTHP